MTINGSTVSSYLIYLANETTLSDGTIILFCNFSEPLSNAAITAQAVLLSRGWNLLIY
jgi:hypothetical protein